ncbi:MAG TPA: sialidase family protein, partial [Chloroflexia bacterium]|nr:sialidase family protein [Chloroflexia bacterium]
MTQIYVATQDGLAVLRREGAGWQAALQLAGVPVQCIVVDPLDPARVYAGTWGRGLWRSEDAGATWEPAGPGITHSDVTAVAVSPVERGGMGGIVWAGTEPSALFRSDDSGRTWKESTGLQALPSKPTWSFPPRPHTHHVRALAFSRQQPGLLFAAIEAGALVRSPDGGTTWEDRVPAGPIDSHTLATHPLAPGRLYAAAGEGFGRAGLGYAESPDEGATWTHPDEGLTRHYLFGMAVDPANPETVLV